MKSFIMVVIVLCSFIGLVAEESMCFQYAKYMPGKGSVASKINDCEKSLYEKECGIYQNAESLCIELLHYAGDNKIASR